MSLFVLDTDILTHLERGELSVVEHVRRRSASELATTVITVEQKLAGWYTYIRQARNPQHVVHGY
jgi:predicted nucleic acid-binding protein